MTNKLFRKRRAHNQFTNLDLKLSKLIKPVTNKFKFLINSSKLVFEQIKFTDRVKISGIIFTNDSNKSRFNNGCVQLLNNEFGFIHKIIVTEENKVYFLYKELLSYWIAFTMLNIHDTNQKTSCAVFHMSFLFIISITLRKYAL